MALLIDLGINAFEESTVVGINAVAVRTPVCTKQSILPNCVCIRTNTDWLNQWKRSTRILEHDGHSKFGQTEGYAQLTRRRERS